MNRLCPTVALLLAALIIGQAEAQQDRPAPAAWKPLNGGEGYYRIPSPGQVQALVIDANEEPQLFSLGVIGGEYRMEFELKRTSGQGGIAIAFPVGNESGVLLLDCYRDYGTLSGIDWVKGFPLTSQENPTARKGRLLENGKSYPLVLEVRRGQIHVTLAGKKLVDAKLGPHDVGGSHWIYPPSPACVGIKVFDGEFTVSRYDARLVPPGGSDQPEPLPPEGVTQILGAGKREDFPKHVLEVKDALTIQSERGELLDFRRPLTVECWYRHAAPIESWFILLDGRMRWELRQNGTFTKRPELSTGAGSGGVFGPIASWDDKWHHLAASSDEYYTNVYFDGKFVSRSLTAYFLRDAARMPLRFGSKWKAGSRISSFSGEIRDFRISRVDRYPRTKSFDPPAVLGRDEPTICKLDLNGGLLEIPAYDKSLGKVLPIDTGENSVKRAE